IIIAGGDHLEHIDTSNLFYYYSYYWNAKFNEGSPNLNISQVFPYILFWFVLKKIGLSLVSIAKIWFILTFILPGLSHIFSPVNIGKETERIIKIIRIIEILGIT
ncbi:unnamed protein product, partial [marine sediment metagenome]